MMKAVKVRRAPQPVVSNHKWWRKEKNEQKITVSSKRHYEENCARDRPTNTYIRSGVSGALPDVIKIILQELITKGKVNSNRAPRSLNLSH
jgi:hypothetical protein